MNFQSIFIFIFSFALLEVFVRFVCRIGFIDTPDHRSNHETNTPSSAGVPIIITIITSTFFFDSSILYNYLPTMIGVVIIFFLGVYDDLKHLRAHTKILFMLLIAALPCWDGIVINNIGTYFGYTAQLKWLAIPLTIFAVVGFTNALNLIDGLDGLAGTISIIILGSLWFIGYQNNDLFLMGLPTLIIPALLAFLIFNWSPARVFMGDSGSLTLGFIISVLSIKTLEYINPVVVLYLLAIPILDTIIIITRRKKYRQEIFSPDKNHIHHVLLNLFQGNIKKTVIFIAFLQLIYALLGIILVRILPQEITLLFFISNIVIWYFVITRVCKNHLKLIKERPTKVPSKLFKFLNR